MLQNPKIYEENNLVEVTGNNNTRHFAGIPTQDGRTLTKKIIRSGVPDAFTQADIKYLKEAYDLKHVIDLRTDFEIDERPSLNDVKGLNYVHIPFNEYKEEDFDGDPSDYPNFWLFVYDALGGSVEAVLEHMAENYTNPFTDDYCKEAVIKFFNHLLSDEESATLFHCTGGKDRTGILSAIFLVAVDVEWDIILKDYIETNTFNQAYLDGELEAVKQLTDDPEVIDGVSLILYADYRYMEAALVAMKAEYGTWDNYLSTGVKLTDADIQKLKAIYTK